MLVKTWSALSDAVRGKRWPEAERIATELEAELAVIATARLQRGPAGQPARDRHRDGLYAIGWQQLIGAPPSTGRAVGRFNRTLHKIPGGVGPQPPRRRGG